MFKSIILSFLMMTSLLADKDYSLLLPTKAKYLTFLSDSGFTEETIGAIYADCDGSAKSAFICALAYDYGYGERGEDIERWYQLAADSNIKIGSKSARMEYADYMIRGGEPGFITSYFKAGECYTKRYRGPCFYYLGMAQYLESGSCKYLNQAAREGTKVNLVKRLCDK